MNNDITNNGKQQRRVTNIFILKTNVLNSGIGGLRMRTSLAYRAAYVTSIYLTRAHIMYSSVHLPDEKFTHLRFRATGNTEHNCTACCSPLEGLTVQ
jgi:hypothetical protein